jgi:photosystem II stability/assembly factor-like uncharacterized protein
MKIALTIILCLVFSAFASAGSWQFLGLGGRHVISLETDPADTQYIYAGTTSGLYISDDGGQFWAPIIPYNVPVVYLANYPYDSDIVIKLIGGGSNSDGLYYSTNRGFTWDVIAYLMNPTSVGFDPIDTGLIYISLMDGILTSSNFGQSVAPANNGLPDLNISDVLGDGRNNLEAYAVGPAFVAHTTDFGNSWDTLEGLFGLECYNPVRIAHDALCSETLYVSCYSYVAVTENGGATWRYTAMAGVGFKPIACDPDTPGKVFVGSADGYGVFESVDAGLSFIPINGNLGNLYVNCLKFLANGKLLAGTADGVYKYDFNAGIDDKPQTLPDNFTLLQNYPNPFNGSTKISISKSLDISSRIEIFDITGRLITRLDVPAHATSVLWDGTDADGLPVSSGIYFAKATTAGQSSCLKLNLLR